MQYRISKNSGTFAYSVTCTHRGRTLTSKANTLKLIRFAIFSACRHFELQDIERAAFDRENGTSWAHE